MVYYLAIDIGASSGRFILSHLDDHAIKCEEVYRFDNKMVEKNNHIYWDIHHLKQQIFEGLKVCKTIGKAPTYVGIDSFGVDYCLLDGNNYIIGDVFSYRDQRTVESMKQFHQQINQVDYYKLTGVQPQIYNTVYQLYSDRLLGRLDKAKKIVMLPSYLNYILTGYLANEKTILSTSGLMNMTGDTYCDVVLNQLGLTLEHFPVIVEPGTLIGKVKQSVSRIIGYSPTVIAVCQHDTASAVLGSYSDDSTIFLSSGTWSLLGTLTKEKINDMSAYKLGFTNESAYGNENRFLKNIMGMWIIQQLKKENHPDLTYAEITEMAEAHNNYNETIDVNNNLFLSPKSMTQAIYTHLAKQNKKHPEHIGEIYFLVFNSLAKEYAKSIYDLECIVGSKFNSINIVGGGSQNRLLNQLTELYTQMKVINGPVEATAIGNSIVQMIYDKKSNISLGVKKKYIRSLIYDNKEQ